MIQTVTPLALGMHNFFRLLFIILDQLVLFGDFFLNFVTQVE